MKALDNAKAIYDLTMNERCEEKVQVLFSNGLHKLMIDLIEELEELEDRSCIGCINLTRSNSQDCISCSRQYQDNFKIIKNKDKITNI